MKHTLTILGAGGWGGNWTERALSDPDWDVLAFADANPDVLARLAERGVARERLFPDAQAALDTVKTDAVTISLPNPARVPLLHQTVAAGRHILADKPLVHTAKELQALLDAARNRKSVFMAAQNYRQFSMSRFAQRWLAETGGRVVAVHAHFLRRLRIPPAYFVTRLPGITGMGVEMCIHHFDMMRFLLGADPVAVEANGWNTGTGNGAGYDGLAAHLGFPGGVNVAYDATWSAHRNATDWPGHWEIVTEKGGLTLGREGRSIEAYDADGNRTASPEAKSDPVDTGESNDRVWAEFKAAIAAVEGGAAAPGAGFCPIEDNARSLAIAYAAGESIAHGRAMDFKAFLEENGI